MRVYQPGSWITAFWGEKLSSLPQILPETLSMWPHDYWIYMSSQRTFLLEQQKQKQPIISISHSSNNYCLYLWISPRGGGNFPIPCLWYLFPVLVYSVPIPCSSGLVPCSMKFYFKLKYYNMWIVTKPITNNSTFTNYQERQKGRVQCRECREASLPRILPETLSMWPHDYWICMSSQRTFLLEQQQKKNNQL